MPDLVDVYDRYASSKHFRKLRESGSALVPGTGPEDAKVMVIGDCPGATENDSRIPFTGRSGYVLNQLVTLAGLRREDLRLTYVVKYRAPGGRPPTVSEVVRSVKFLRQEWMLLRPVITIAAGNLAAAAIEAEDGVHGGLFPYWTDPESGVSHLVCVMYHPAFGLKSTKARTWIEKEWGMLGEEIRERAPEVLCQSCLGAGPRGKKDCKCWAASS